MARRLPPLNALRAFEAAGRRQSFVGAARELNVSHAAISRHVRGLEARLGVDLFRTAKRGVALTEAGESYLAEISHLFDGIEGATDRLTGDAHRRLVVSAEPNFALKWLAPRLHDFLAAHRDFEVSVDSSRRLADLRAGECDLAIRWTLHGYSGPEAELISDQLYYPVAAPALVAGLSLPLPPEAILALPLLHDFDGGMWRRWFEAAGLPDPALPPGQGRISGLMVHEAAAAGRGCFLASPELAETDIGEGRLVWLSDIGLRDGAYHLIRAPGAEKRAPAAAFRAWLMAETAPLRT